MNTVAAGLGADVVHGVAGAGCDALDDVRGLRDPETEHVDERVAGVALVEADLAADRRDADAVAVAGDARDDARKGAPHERIVERAEAQRVEERDWSRAHREDVADDAADAGRGALVRLDEGGMVVRF